MGGALADGADEVGRRSPTFQRLISMPPGRRVQQAGNKRPR